jgi:parallel beta-helix repeat protein
MYVYRVPLAILALITLLLASPLPAGGLPAAGAQTNIPPATVQGSGAPFFLTSVANPNVCADVAGASRSPVTPVIAYTCNFNLNEQFVWLADGTIRAFAGSALCLDDSGAQGRDGDSIISYNCNGGANQRWAATANGSIQGINGKCIDIYSGAVVDGTKLILWPCTGASNQRWAASTGSVPSSAPAPSGVNLSPGSNVQAAVNANPPGTVFVLNSGTYYGQSVVPKSGDVFYGQPGAVLDGQNAPYAFSKGAPPYPANVTVRGLKIVNYSPKTQQAAVDAGGFSASELTSGWVIDGNEVANNAEYGIRAGNSTQVINNNIHHNQRLDLAASGDDILVANNEIAFGNYNYVANLDFEAGGTKFTNTNRLTVRNNYVHDNLGGALWLDSGNINTLIEGNRVVNNTNDGIASEISYSAVIRNNTVTGNGWHDPLNRYSYLWNAGIAVHSSPNVEIYGNTVSDNYAGIVAVQQNRSIDPPIYGPHLVQNLYVHDNTVTQSNSPSGAFQLSVAAGVAQDIGDNSVFTGWGNRFVNNTYFLGANPQPFAWMNGTRTVSSWQQFGLDSSGIFNR